MQPFLRYVTTHWSGEQSLARAFFLNVLLTYLAMVIALIVVGSLVNNQSVVLIGIAVFILVLCWSLVGLIRTAIRILSSPHARIGAKVFALCAVALTAIALWVMANDFSRLGLI